MTDFSPLILLIFAPSWQSPSDTPPHINDPVTRPPPPLSIPQPVAHHYSLGSNSANHNQNTPLFNLPNPGFQMPNTPSGSSATSSPPFSVSIFIFPLRWWTRTLVIMSSFSLQQPVQMQPPLHSSMDHRSHLSDHHAIPHNYTHSAHYTSIKVEDEHYMVRFVVHL